MIICEGVRYVQVTMLLTMPVPLDEAGKLLLPDNLIVGGDLDLSGTPIEALPENLTVGGNLDLRDTAITALPENLAIGGDLYILSDVEEIPATVKIGGKINRTE